MQEGSDRYHLDERIGQGGMAEVWRGRRRLASGTWQKVAIKRLFGFLNSEPLLLAQLEREARICMELRHENLVSVHDLDMVDGQHSVIMEYVDGITLRELMDCRAISPPMVRAILRDVLAGLDHAHKRGVLHRDISARNIMITRDGVAKMMDFGLAKNLRAESENVGFKGTVAYASREALECGLYTRGSDMYSVGAVFYEALTHAPPYGTGDRLDMVRSMEHGPRPRLPDDAPDDLRAFIEFALGPTETRTDAAADEAIARLHASPSRVMSRDELAESIGEMLDTDARAAADPAPPEHADTLAMLEHTQEPKFKPEEWAAQLAAANRAANGEAEASKRTTGRAASHKRPPATRTGPRGWQRSVVPVLAVGLLVSITFTRDSASPAVRNPRTANLVQASADHVADRVIGPNQIATPPSRTLTGHMPPSSEESPTNPAEHSAPEHASNEAPADPRDVGHAQIVAHVQRAEPARMPRSDRAPTARAEPAHSHNLTADTTPTPPAPIPSGASYDMRTTVMGSANWPDVRAVEF